MLTALLLGLTFPLAGSGPLQQRELGIAHYFSRSKFRAVGFPAPPGCRIETVAIAQDTIKITMRGDLPSKEDHLMIEAFFSSGHVVAFAYGKAELMSPRVASGDAVAINLDGRATTAKVPAEIGADYVGLKLKDTGLPANRLHYVVARFLPGFVDLADVAGEMGGCITDVWVYPDAGKQRVTICNLLYDVMDRRTSLWLPIGAEFGHPPHVVPGVKINKEFDFDRDGVRDYDFKLSWPYGKRGTRVAVVYLDNGVTGAGVEDSVAVIWGVDFDLDGRINPNEMLGMSSRVPLVLGHVAMFVEVGDPDTLLHIISFNPETKGFTHTVGKFASR